MRQIQQELEAIRSRHKEEGGKMSYALREAQRQLEEQQEAMRQAFANHVLKVHEQKMALDLHLQQARNIAQQEELSLRRMLEEKRQKGLTEQNAMQAALDEARSWAQAEYDSLHRRFAEAVAQIATKEDHLRRRRPGAYATAAVTPGPPPPPPPPAAAIIRIGAKRAPDASGKLDRMIAAQIAEKKRRTQGPASNNPDLTQVEHQAMRQADLEALAIAQAIQNANERQERRAQNAIQAQAALANIHEPDQNAAAIAHPGRQKWRLRGKQPIPQGYPTSAPTPVRRRLRGKQTPPGQQRAIESTPQTTSARRRLNGKQAPPTEWRETGAAPVKKTTMKSSSRKPRRTPSPEPEEEIPQKGPSSQRSTLRERVSFKLRHPVAYKLKMLR